MIAPPHSKEVQEFQFKLQSRLRVWPGNKSLDVKRPLKLLSSSSKYGLTFIGCPNGIQCINVANIISLSANQQKARKYILDYPRRDLVLGETPTHLDISCDNELLAVALSVQNCSVLYVYSVTSFGSKEISRKYELRLSNTPGVQVLDIQWNPRLQNMLGAVLSDGTVVACEFKDNSFSLNTLPANVQATCLCWSPKGKQVVIGAANGTLSQYKPELKLVKSFPPPQLANNPVSVVSVQWLSSFQFAAVYKNLSDSSQRPALVIVNVPKGTPVSYINYDEICYGLKSERPEHFFIHQQDWNLMVVGCGNSMELGVLKQQGDTPGWEQWCQGEATRAELPLTEDHNDVYTVGLSFDTSVNNKIPMGAENMIEPMPVTHMLSHEGVLCMYYTINLLPNAAKLCNPPEALPDQSGMSLFSIPQVSTSAAAVVPPSASQENVTAPISSALPTEATTNLFSSAFTASAPPNTQAGLFSNAPQFFSSPQVTTTAGSLFTSPLSFQSLTQQNAQQQQNTASKPQQSTPIVVPSFPATSAPQQAQVGAQITKTTSQLGSSWGSLTVQQTASPSQQTASPSQQTAPPSQQTSGLPLRASLFQQQPSSLFQQIPSGQQQTPLNIPQVSSPQQNSNEPQQTSNLQQNSTQQQPLFNLKQTLAQPTQQAMPNLPAPVQQTMSPFQQSPAQQQLSHFQKTQATSGQHKVPQQQPLNIPQPNSAQHPAPIFQQTCVQAKHQKPAEQEMAPKQKSPQQTVVTLPPKTNTQPLVQPAIDALQKTTVPQPFKFSLTQGSNFVGPGFVGAQTTPHRKLDAVKAKKIIPLAKTAKRQGTDARSQVLQGKSEVLVKDKCDDITEGTLPSKDLEQKCTAAIQSEIKKFSAELNILKCIISNLNVNIGDEEQKNELKIQTENLEAFGKDLRDTTATQETEVSVLRENLTETYSWFENINEKHMQLICDKYSSTKESSELDPLSRQHIKSIEKNLLFLESNCKLISVDFETIWAQKSGDYKKRTGLETPALETIFQSIMTIYKLINQQKMVIADLENSVPSKIKKKINHSDFKIVKEKKQHIPGNTELSKLAEKLLNTKLGDRDDINSSFERGDKCSTFMPPKNITPLQENKLRQWHKNCKGIRTVIIKKRLITSEMLNSTMEEPLMLAQSNNKFNVFDQENGELIYHPSSTLAKTPLPSVKSDFPSFTGITGPASGFTSSVSASHQKIAYPAKGVFSISSPNRFVAEGTSLGEPAGHNDGKHSHVSPNKSTTKNLSFSENGDISAQNSIVTSSNYSRVQVPANLETPIKFSNETSKAIKSSDVSVPAFTGQNKSGTNKTLFVGATIRNDDTKILSEPGGVKPLFGEGDASNKSAGNIAPKQSQIRSSSVNIGTFSSTQPPTSSIPGSSFTLSEFGAALSTPASIIEAAQANESVGKDSSDKTNNTFTFNFSSAAISNSGVKPLLKTPELIVDGSGNGKPTEAVQPAEVKNETFSFRGIMGNNPNPNVGGSPFNWSGATTGNIFGSATGSSFNFGSSKDVENVSKQGSETNNIPKSESVEESISKPTAYVESTSKISAGLASSTEAITLGPGNVQLEPNKPLAGSISTTQISTSGSFFGSQSSFVSQPVASSDLPTTTSSQKVDTPATSTSIFGSSSLFWGSSSNSTAFPVLGTSDTPTVFGNSATPTASQSVFGSPTVSTAPTSQSEVDKPPIAPTANSPQPQPILAATTSSLPIFGSASAAATVLSTQPSSAPDASASVTTSQLVFGSTTAAVTTTASRTVFSGLTATGTTASQSIFGSTPTATATTTSTSIFGSTPTATATTTSQPVCESASAPTTTTTSQPVFGSTPAPTVTTTSPPVFGSTPALTATTTSQPAFGSTPAPAATTTSPLVFSAPTAAATSSQPLFGSTVTTISTTTSAPVFESTPATTTSQLIFGTSSASTTTSQPIFGSSAAPATTSQSIFGSVPAATTSQPIFSSSPATATTSQSIFGGSASTANFGSADNTAAASLFGSTLSFATPPKTTSSSFGSNAFGNPTTTSSIFATAATSTFGAPSVFGTPSTSGGDGSSFFGQAVCSPVATTSSNVFGAQPANSFFGQATPSASTTSSLNFGSAASSPSTFASKPVFGQQQGGVVNPFGQVSNTGNFGSSGGSLFGNTGFGSQNQQQSNLFQSSGKSGNSGGTSLFGGVSSPGTGSFSAGGQSIGQTGFGSPPAFQNKSSAFGASGSSVFGSQPAFGTPPAFGGAPTFGSPNKMFASNSPTVGFGNLAQSTQPSTFETLATQNTMTFGNLAQAQPPATGFFGAQQPPTTQSGFGGNSFSTWR